MLGQRIEHPTSTNFYDVAGGANSPPAKRRRTDDVRGSPSKFTSKQSVNDSSDQDTDLNVDEPPPKASQTDLESALPPVRTDQEAIEEYETLRAAEQAELSTIEGRLNDRTWTRGKNSIYVDAFNLTLRTVLEEESHLFDEAEKSLFEHWRGLSYDAQYLYAILPRSLIV